MRLFVAIAIPDEVRSAIGDLIKSLRNTCRDARWVRVAGLHVTIKFIGETSSERLAELRGVLASIRPLDPVAMNFGGFGFFPNARRPRVLWAGVEAGPNLAALASAVENALALAGSEQEDRAFTPHLTLARFKDSAGVDALQAAIEKAGPLKFGSTTAKEFHLYQSVLKPGGAEYTRLASFSLSGSKSE